jgi:hypothetical protein
MGAGIILERRERLERDGPRQQARTGQEQSRRRDGTLEKPMATAAVARLPAPIEAPGARHHWSVRRGSEITGKAFRMAFD